MGILSRWSFGCEAGEAEQAGLRIRWQLLRRTETLRRLGTGIVRSAVPWGVHLATGPSPYAAVCIVSDGCLGSRNV